MSEALLSSGAGRLETSPGRQLTVAREGRGLSVADIAQQLKLSPGQVEALEADDYRRLPGAVFVRGFIRNYARLLKLDSAMLLANAEGAFPQPAAAAPQAPPPAEIPFPRARNFNWWYKYAIAAIVVVIPLVIFEFYWDDTPPPTAKSTQVEQPAPQVVAETAPAAGAAATPVTTGDAAPQTEAKSSTSVDAGRPAETAKPAAGEQVVRLRFARESWVEIRDRNGRKIFSQLNSPGTEQVVSGLPPLSLVVGNANGVQVTHNEQPVDLGPHIKIDVARLTLE